MNKTHAHKVPLSSLARLAPNSNLEHRDYTVMYKAPGQVLECTDLTPDGEGLFVLRLANGQELTLPPVAQAIVHHTHGAELPHPHPWTIDLRKSPKGVSFWATLRKGTWGTLNFSAYLWPRPQGMETDEQICVGAADDPDSDAPMTWPSFWELVADVVEYSWRDIHDDEHEQEPHTSCPFCCL